MPYLTGSYMDLTIFLILVPFALTVQVLALVKHWQHHTAWDGKLLLWVIAAGIGWVAFNTLEVLAQTGPSKIFWTQATFVIIASIPVLLISFALRLVDWWKYLTPVRATFLFAPFVLTELVLLTANHHQLFWQSYRFVSDGVFLRMTVSYGPWFYIHAGYAFLLVITATVMIVWAYPHTHKLYRQQTIVIALGILFPLTSSILYVLDLLPWQKDFAPIAYSAATWACGRAMARYRLFDLRPIARRILVDNMPDAMLLLNERDEVVDLNPAASQILNTNVHTAIGRPLSELLNPQLRSAFVPIKTATDVQREITLPRSDGEYVYDLKMTRIVHQHGIESGRLIVLHDISARRQAEQVIQRANEDLKARNEELDAFAHTVAHDLRSPLQAIQGFAEILRDEWDGLSDEMRRECMDTILDSTRHMDEIIDALLLLAGVRKQSVEIQPVRMDEVVAGTLKSLDKLIHLKNASVEADDSWPEALGFTPWIQVVLTNYLTNALKYSGNHPRIKLGATVLPEGMVRYWVRDNGPGLSIEQQARLFTPFSRIHEDGAEGHGLGLSIVKRIMSRLGGSCGVESSGIPGEGCTFYFTLPGLPHKTFSRQPAFDPPGGDGDIETRVSV